MDLSWTFSILEKNNVIWPGFTAYKLYGGCNCKRIVDIGGYKSDGRKIFIYNSVHEWQGKNTKTITINLG